MPRTIFNTTEKSNFILNMKEESVDKLALYVLAGVCILITLSQIPAEFGYSLTDFPLIALGISGVFTVVTGIIMFLRKRAGKANMVSICLTAFLFIWSLVSYYCSFNLNTALWGQDGRYDGLVTTILYIFLFLTASMISERNIERLFDIIVGAGVFQCLWSLYQKLPFAVSYYKNLEVIAVDDVYLTSGLTGSPFFFAMLMTVMMAVAMFGSMFTESKKRKIFYTISMVFFVFGILNTHTLSGITGIITIEIAVLIMGVCCKKVKTVSFVGTVIILVIAFISLLSDYTFYDGGIAWQDSFYRLGVTGYYSFSNSDFDVNNLQEVYSYFWNEAVTAIKEYPVAGTGIDCFIYTQYKTSPIIQYELNSIDRPYNDYLFLCATRGIPYLAGYISLLIYSLVNSIKTAKSNDKWYLKAIPVIIIAFMAVSVFNNSSVAVMPFIWIILGLSVNRMKNFE